MVQSIPATSRTFVRDVVVATLVLVALYGLARGVQFQPVQIPGYLIIVGFDAVEGLFGSAGNSYPVLFSVYILGLGLTAATISTVLRERSRDTDLPGWRSGMAGALAVVGTLSIVFGVVMFLGTTQSSPVLVAGIAGVVLLGLAGWLAGLIGLKQSP